MKGLIITEEEKKRIKTLYGIGSQKNVLLEYKGQEIPITMNQAMQFQRWVWTAVDGNPNPDNMTDAQEKTKYRSTLCDQPCSAWGEWYPTGNGTYYRKGGAIDGYFGGKTQSAWNYYKARYVKLFPTWDYDSPSFDKRVTGTEGPTTVLQTKNFQKWYLEEIEKFCNDYDDIVKSQYMYQQMGCKKGISRDDNMFTTQLCGGVRCKYEKAVDGYGMADVNSNTYKLWQKYKDQYKPLNKEWDKEKEWSLGQQQWEDKEREDRNKRAIQRSEIAKLPLLWLDPSGYDGKKTRYTDNPRWSNLNDNKYWKIQSINDRSNQTGKENSNQHYADFGWKALPNLYPEPRQFTQADFDKVLFESSYVYQTGYLYLKTANGLVAVDENQQGWVPSRQEDWRKPGVEMIIGDSDENEYTINQKNYKEYINKGLITQKDWDDAVKENDELWEKQQQGLENWDEWPDYYKKQMGVEPFEIQVVKGMMKFNKELARQYEDIPNYCTGISGPWIKYKGGDGNFADDNNNPSYLWIRTDDACAYAGGSWVHNFGGQKICGCRDNSAPYVINPTDQLASINRPGYEIREGVALPKLFKRFEYKAENDFQWNEPLDYAKVINDVSPWISIPLMIVAPWMGAPMLAVEAACMAIDLIDAAAYAARGDKYGAGLALLFAVVGAPNIMKKIPGMTEALEEVGGASKLALEKVSLKIGEAIAAGGKAIDKYLPILKGITDQGAWLKAAFEAEYPNLAKKMANASKTAGKLTEPVAKVGVVVGKALLKMAKWSLEKLVRFILWLVKTDFFPVSFLRNAGMMIGGTFMAWDMIAYALGLCSSIPMEHVEKMVEDMDKLENNPAAFTEDDKEFLKQRPWLATVYFTKYVSTAQMFTEPCQKYTSYLEIKKIYQKQQAEWVKNTVQQINNQKDSVNFKVKEILEEIIGTYTPLPIPFDPTVLAVQLVLNHFLKNRPATTEPLTISKWGTYDQNTALAIAQFKEYAHTSEDKVIDKNFNSEDEFDTSITEKLAKALIKYIDNLSEQIDNPTDYVFEKESMKKIVDEAIANTNALNGKPSSEPAEVVVTYGKEFNSLPDDKKIEIINGMNKIGAGEFKFQSKELENKVDEFNKQGN